jgi:hypothetical protein
MAYTIVEKIDPNIKYDPKDNDDIVNSVKALFSKMDEKRAKQKTQIAVIQKLLSPNDTISTIGNVESFEEEYRNSKFKQVFLKDSSLRRIRNTMIAHLFSSSFKLIHNIFSIDLSPEYNDEQRAQFTAMQKRTILDEIKKSKSDDEFRKGCINAVDKGEMIYKLSWSRKFQDVRRRATFDFLGLEIPLDKYEYQRVIKSDGISIKCIEPENLVYDKEKNIYIEETWMTVQDILNNQEFKKYLTGRQRKELEELAKTDIPDGTDGAGYAKNGLLKVLEYEGDFYLKGNSRDNEHFHNMKICVIDDKYVGYFNYNPNIMCSYFVKADEIDPETGRGVSVLAHLISGSIAITDCINKTKTALDLSVEPHHFIKESAFIQKEGNEIKLTPGGTTSLNLEPGESIASVMLPIDMSTALNIGKFFIDFQKDENEEMSQVFKLSSGDIEKAPKTLGQSKLQVQGQNVVFSFKFDPYIDLEIELVEGVGEMLANMKDNPERIRYRDQMGNESVGVIDGTVRQAGFEYSINSSSISSEKKMNTLEYLEYVDTKLTPLAMQQGQMPNVEERLNILSSAYEQENAQKLFNKPMGDMNGQQGTIPPELPPNADIGIQGGLPMG